MDDNDTIDGRWKVVGEVDYSGPPPPTGAENWAEVGRRLGKLFVWAFTVAGVYLVTACAHLMMSGS